MPMSHMPMAPIQARPLGMHIARIAVDFPPIPIAIGLASTPVVPLDMFLADMVSMDMVLTQAAPQDMVHFLAPTLGGVSWGALEWTEPNRVLTAVVLCTPVDAALHQTVATILLLGWLAVSEEGKASDVFTSNLTACDKFDAADLALLAALRGLHPGCSGGPFKREEPPEGGSSLGRTIGGSNQNFTRAPPMTASKSSVCALPFTQPVPPVQLMSAEKCRQLR